MLQLRYVNECAHPYYTVNRKPHLQLLQLRRNRVTFASLPATIWIFYGVNDESVVHTATDFG